VGGPSPANSGKHLKPDRARWQRWRSRRDAARLGCQAPHAALGPLGSAQRLGSS